MKKILQEAYHTNKLLGNDSIDNTVSVYNFKDYWQGAIEAISSSFSRLHFGGHYKALSFKNKFVCFASCKFISMCQKRNAISP
jgi:hypothetical protein